MSGPDYRLYDYEGWHALYCDGDLVAQGDSDVAELLIGVMRDHLINIRRDRDQGYVYMDRTGAADFPRHEGDLYDDD